MTRAQRAVFSALITVACYSLPFLLALGAVAFVVWEADFALWTSIERLGVLFFGTAFAILAPIPLEASQLRRKLIKALLEDMDQ